jgi:hypothetical protein
LYARKELGVFRLAEVLEIFDVLDEALVVEDLGVREVVEIEGVGEALYKLDTRVSKARYKQSKAAYLEFYLESRTAGLWRWEWLSGHFCVCDEERWWSRLELVVESAVKLEVEQRSGLWFRDGGHQPNPTFSSPSLQSRMHD